MGPYLRLARVGNVATSFVGTVVGGLAARGVGFSLSDPLIAALLLAGVSTACVTAGGNILNDLGDRDSDRTNHPDRPLVTGEVTVQSARQLTVILLVLSGVLIVPLVRQAPTLAIILGSALLALLGYEFAFKSKGISGNLLVAFLTASVFLYGGAAAGRIELVVPFALMAFSATLSREVIKDMEDAPGDVDRATLPRTHGLGTASAVARASVGVAIALSPVPVVTYLTALSATGIMYMALVLAADVLFVVSVAYLPKRLHQEQSLSKGAMTVALLAFLAVAFR